MKNGKAEKHIAGQGLVMLCYVLTGAACGLLFLQYMEHAGLSGLSRAGRILVLLGLFVSFYAAMMIQLILHEGGHLVFGLLTGYRFCSFRVLSLMWVREGERIRFRRMKIAGTGGQCLMAPPALREGRMPVLWYNLGGSLMNLLTGVLFLVPALLSPAWTFGRLFLFMLALSGASLALVNGLPLRLGAVNNDGRNALDLARDREAVRAFWLQLKVTEEVSGGIRLRDMPGEWFYVPREERWTNGIIAAAGAITCSRLMDEHRFGEADALMARLLSGESGIVGVTRSQMVCDRMYVLLLSGDASGAKALRTRAQEKLMKAQKTNPTVLRTEYAFALLSERDPEKADALRARFEKAVRSSPYPGEINAERELMEIAAAAFRGEGPAQPDPRDGPPSAHRKEAI